MYSCTQGTRPACHSVVLLTAHSPCLPLGARTALKTQIHQPSSVLGNILLGVDTRQSGAVFRDLRKQHAHVQAAWALLTTWNTICHSLYWTYFPSELLF